MFIVSVVVALAGCSGSLGFGASSEGSAVPAGGGQSYGGGSSGPSSSGGSVAVASGGGAAQAGPPGNWSMAEREYWSHLQEELDGYATTTNGNCGTTITATFVHETFRGRMTEGGSYGLDGYTRSTCAAPVTALSNICQRGAMQQQSVQNRIRRVECAWGPTNYALDANGTMRVSINTDDNNASGYETEMETWLGTQL
jgi:hypothetical protein